MSFPSLLTHTRLRALAGYSYERGERYWREGRVQAYVQQGDGVAGVVVGGEEYAVRVFAHGRTITSQCSCPVGGGELLCKHAVALALQYLEAPVDKDTPATSSAFETRQELEAWCSEHQVMHELAVAAEVLFEDVSRKHGHPNLTFVLRSLSLRDVGSLESASKYVGIRALHRPVVEAAARHLARAAEDVRTALDEERQPRSVAATDATVAALASRLADLRAT